MDYIEQLNLIFSVNEDVCGGFTGDGAQKSWDILTKELGFQDKTFARQNATHCKLYLPPQDRMNELKTAGWPDVVWQFDYPEFEGVKGQPVQPGQPLESTHGSTPRAAMGCAGELRRRFGIFLSLTVGETFDGWKDLLGKEIGDMNPIYKYLEQKYPREYQRGREVALKQFWRDSLSRPAAAAEKLRADAPELFLDEEEREKREIANFEAVLRTIGNGSRWFITNQDLTSLAANPSEENLDKVLQNFEAVDLARGEVRGPTAAQMTAALDDYEKRLRQVGDEILDKLT